MELSDTIPGMMSADYKERFIAEYRQTAIRTEKLRALLDKAYANDLSFELSCPISILEHQFYAMRNYLDTLSLRAHYENIELFVEV